MRPSASVPALPGSLVAVAALVLLLAAPQPALAKRFDCRMFCRSTGFTGMVGGCRCSFTLFTAKRSVRDQHSVPEERDSLTEAVPLDSQYHLSLADLVRMTRASHDNLPSLDDYRVTGDSTGLASNSGANANYGSSSLPENHPLRLLAKSNGSAAGTQKPHLRVAQSPSQMLLKRKEFEQDLDNGDTSDFLRLPY